MRMIQRLSADGYTIVLITHNEEIARQAQRTVYVRDGRLFGTLEEAEQV
jgi:putative ABC transport system ATP-binding protein